MKTEFLIILIQRVKSENPEFFKRIQFYSLLTMVIIGFFYGILEIDLFCINPTLLEKLKTLCYALETFLGGVLATSYTTTTDPKLVSKDTKEKILEEKYQENLNN